MILFDCIIKAKSNTKKHNLRDTSVHVGEGKPGSEVNQSGRATLDLWEDELSWLHIDYMCNQRCFYADIFIPAFFPAWSINTGRVYIIVYNNIR